MLVMRLYRCLLCLFWILVLFVATSATPLVLKETLRLPTKGASGLEFISFFDDSESNRNQAFLWASNFFTSSSQHASSVETTSELFRLVSWRSKEQQELRFQAETLHQIPTRGAHGVESVFISNGQVALVAIPNFYGPDTVVLEMVRKNNGGDGEPLVETIPIQRIPTKGAGAVEFLQLKISSEQRTPTTTTTWLAIAEFYAGEVSIHEYQHTNKLFVERQRLAAPGVAALSHQELGGKYYLFAACYYSPQNGFDEPSRVAELTNNNKFEWIQEISTVGAHDVESVLIDDNGRCFVFFANDKNATSVKVESELFEWTTTNQTTGTTLIQPEMISVQKIQTNGAHGATFFRFLLNRTSSSSSSYYHLAVANFGNRDRKEYRANSTIYQLNPPPPIEQQNKQSNGETRDASLKVVAQVETKGATDFGSFVMDGETFLMVSNEQDEERGADIESIIWRVLPTEERPSSVFQRSDEL